MPFDNPNQNPTGDVQLLWDARTKVAEKSSWVQGRYSDVQRLCLAAALSVVAGSRSFDAPNRLERRLARLVAGQLPETVPFWTRIWFLTGRQRLVWYNDEPSTTHQDILSLLDRALHRAMQQMPAHIAA